MELPGPDANLGNSVFILKASIFLFLFFFLLTVMSQKYEMFGEKKGSHSINSHYTTTPPQLSAL